MGWSRDEPCAEFTAPTIAAGPGEPFAHRRVTREVVGLGAFAVLTVALYAAAIIAMKIGIDVRTSWS